MDIFQSTYESKRNAIPQSRERSESRRSRKSMSRGLFWCSPSDWAIRIARPQNTHALELKVSFKALRKQFHIDVGTKGTKRGYGVSQP